jgi:hypothetical protein
MENNNFHEIYKQKKLEIQEIKENKLQNLNIISNYDKI